MICIDTHLHFYGFYDARAFLGSLVRNLEAIAPGCEKAGVVLNRAEGNSFEMLKEAAVGMPDLNVRASELSFEYEIDGCKCRIFSGVQVACRERFEVLGLFCHHSIDDGVSARDALQIIRSAGGLPVLAWAPGKWMFSRKHIVEDLLKGVHGRSLFIGDTSLRPSFWGEPRLMHDYRLRGGKVVCGSDPLPVGGEEFLAGTYASKLNVDAGADAADMLKRCLETDQVGLGAAGQRCGPAKFASRMLRARTVRR